MEEKIKYLEFKLLSSLSAHNQWLQGATGRPQKTRLAFLSGMLLVL